MFMYVGICGECVSPSIVSLSLSLSRVTSLLSLSPSLSQTAPSPHHNNYLRFLAAAAAAAFLSARRFQALTK